MEHDVGEIARRDILQPTQHLTLPFHIGKNVKGGHSAKESVWKEVGRLGEESSILHLSRYLLKFTLDLYFADIYGPLTSCDNVMIEEPDIPRFLCRTTTKTPYRAFSSG